MGNVLRVLGIVVASMVVGVSALVLVIFTICGGFKNPGPESTMTLVVCLSCIAGAITAIVFLARGIKPSGSTQPGLAVPPAPPAPAARIGPLTGTELQGLIFLRIALAAYILLALASTALSSIVLARLEPRFLLMNATQTLLNVLPGVLALLLLRNPPSGLATDLAIAPAAAAILYRLVYTGGMAAFSGLLERMPQPATFLLRLAVFTALEGAIIWLGTMVRRRADAGNYGRLIGLIIAFLVYEAMSGFVFYLFF